MCNVDMAYLISNIQSDWASAGEKHMWLVTVLSVIYMTFSSIKWHHSCKFLVIPISFVRYITWIVNSKRINDAVQNCAYKWL